MTLRVASHLCASSRHFDRSAALSKTSRGNETGGAEWRSLSSYRNWNSRNRTPVNPPLMKSVTIRSEARANNSLSLDSPPTGGNLQALAEALTKQHRIISLLKATFCYRTVSIIRCWKYPQPLPLFLSSKLFFVQQASPIVTSNLAGYRCRPLRSVSQNVSRIYAGYLHFNQLIPNILSWYILGIS